MSIQSPKGYLRPWILGACSWWLCSLVILLQYLRLPDPTYAVQLWWLLSLLWLQFPFAGLFHCLRSARYRQLPELLLLALAPPALLHLLVFFLLA